MPLSPIHLIVSNQTPIISKILCFTLCISYLSTLLFPREYASLRHHYWFSLMTFSFIEPHVLVLLIQCWLFLYLSNYLNQKCFWGDGMLLRFLSVCVVSSIVALFVSDGLFGFASVSLGDAHQEIGAAAGNEALTTGDALNSDALMVEPLIEGMEALILGLLVAWKQIAPDEALLLPSFRGSQAWFLWLIWILVWGFCITLWDGFSPLYLVYSSWIRFVVFSSCVASTWVYLRYFQVKEDGTRGDESDSFAFETFLPAPLRPTVTPILNRLSESSIGKSLRSKQGRKINSRTNLDLSSESNHDSEVSIFMGESKDTASDTRESMREKQIAAALREVQSRM